ncbi:7202_t:CDS:1, partial [Funneliformis mosseae]
MKSEDFDPESESESEPNDFKGISLVSKSQTSLIQPKNDNYNLFKGQIAEID